MTASATIRFARPGVRAPVFVVTSATTPPWGPVEMLDSGERTASGEIIFQRTFDDIAHGAHQYKIRVGQDLWILDEDKEIATDESGNRNNVIHSELKFNQPGAAVPDVVPGPVSQHPDDSMHVEANTTFQYPPAKDEQEPQRREGRQDSVHPPHAPFPTVAVEKLRKQSPVTDGDTERHDQESHVGPGTVEHPAPLFSHDSSESDHPTQDSASKSPVDVIEGQPCDSSTDNAGSEIEMIAPPGDELNDGPHLPHEVSERQASPHGEFDNAPRFPHEIDSGSEDGQTTGDDGELANAPLMSHEMRSNADAQAGDLATDELSNAPLMPHEAGLSAPSPDVSEWSGVEHASSVTHEIGSFYDGADDSTSPSGPLSDFGSTPSSPSESGFSRPRVGGRDNRHHLSPEQKSALMKRRRGMIINTTPLSSGDGTSELDQAPLLSHEAGSSPRSETSDDLVGELDHAPLMPHEADSSGGRSEDASTADQSRLAPVFSHERAIASSDENAEDNDAPLLPHERPSPVSGLSSKEFFHETGKMPAVAYRGPESPPVFIRHTSSRLWKARSNSSSLPHSLPRSDEEDENLNDPSLEPFPTQRRHILERVATISHHLPEDETLPSPGGVHSPAIMSQACSSVDLEPVGSHSSQRIAEDALMEGDEDEDDVALGSPAMKLSIATDGEAEAPSDAPAPTGAVAAEDLLTPMPHRQHGNYLDLDDQQQDDSQQDDSQEQGGGRVQSFATIDADDRTLVGSVYGNDGVGETDLFATAGRRRWTPDALARPASALDPILTTPTLLERRQLFPWEFEDQQTSGSDSTQRLADIQAADGYTPSTQYVYRSPLYLRAWRRLFAQHGILPTAAVCGALVAAVFSWWWYYGGGFYAS